MEGKPERNFQGENQNRVRSICFVWGNISNMKCTRSKLKSENRLLVWRLGVIGPFESATLLIQSVTERRNCKCKLNPTSFGRWSKRLLRMTRSLKDLRFVCFKEYQIHYVLVQKASNQCIRLKIQERGDKDPRKDGSEWDQNCKWKN